MEEKIKTLYFGYLSDKDKEEIIKDEIIPVISDSEVYTPSITDIPPSYAILEEDQVFPIIEVKYLDNDTLYTLSNEKIISLKEFINSYNQNLNKNKRN